MTIETVTLDLDGTLLPDTTAFMEVLRQTGHEEAVRASDARYFAGTLSLHDCFVEQWALFQTLAPVEIHRALRQAAWIPDLPEGIQSLRDAGLDVRMLTDQPSTATDFGGRWGLTPAISSPVTVREGKQESIDFKEDKLANLLDAGLDPTTVMHVGNGSNDVPIWNAAGQGIAVFAEPDVAAQASVDLGHPTSFNAVVESVLTLLD